MMFASFAHAVSQVGGGKLRNMDEGYETPLAPKFQRYDRGSADEIRFHGPMAIMPASAGLIPVPQMINVYLLRETFPDLGPIGSDEFETFFITRGWSMREHANECVKVFSKSNASGITWALGWGQGRGIVLAGQRTTDVSEGIESMVRQLELLDGACKWQ